ncbi:MAG: hypothetical protein M3245_00520 [Actinomycetota bacterium]|nr:hypothetical protein [Actinomycetota bacterium]
MRTSVDVHNFLQEREIPHELVPLRDRYRSAERAAAALGLPLRQVGRVFLYEAGDRPVAALVAADRDPSAELVARAAGEAKLDPVPPQRATDMTGFLHEAMPPAGLPANTLVLIDRHLHDEDVLYFAGGEVTSVLKIRAPDLVKATDARVADITG